MYNIINWSIDNLPAFNPRFQVKMACSSQFGNLCTPLLSSKLSKMEIISRNSPISNYFLMKASKGLEFNLVVIKKCNLNLQNQNKVAILARI